MMSRKIADPTRGVHQLHGRRRSLLHTQGYQQFPRPYFLTSFLILIVPSQELVIVPTKLAVPSPGSTVDPWALSDRLWKQDMISAWPEEWWRTCCPDAISHSRMTASAPTLITVLRLLPGPRDRSTEPDCLEFLAAGPCIIVAAGVRIALHCFSDDFAVTGVGWLAAELEPDNVRKSQVATVPSAAALTIKGSVLDPTKRSETGDL